MADRVTVYPTEVPYDTDILKGQKNMYIGLAKLASAILGKNTLIDGFVATPTSVPTLAVQIGEGEIYSLQVVDNNAYGSLAADTTHTIVKQGILMDSVTLPTPAPATVGYSINYLIQVAFSEADVNIVARPYFNSDNPSDPTFSEMSDTRQDQCLVTIKSGIPATTGTQASPTPDTGYVGARVVSVAYGQTTVTSGNISTYSNAPFITEKLIDKLSLTTANSLYKERMFSNTSGSFTVPKLATSMSVSGCGGGAGGGGSAGLNIATYYTNKTGAAGGAGGGGGADFIFNQVVAVTGGETLTYSIGQGGLGGAGGAVGSDGVIGSSGGNTTISRGGTVILTILGGDPGGPSGTPPQPGNIGVAGGGGDNSGANGFVGFYFTNATVGGNGGNGGNTSFGVGGSGGTGNFDSVGGLGDDAYSFGGGGGGGGGSSTRILDGSPKAGAKGGNGAAGVLFTTFN